MSNLLRQLLIEEEAWRNKVYADTKGIPTIGVGRNLRDKGLSDQEINLLFANDMNEAISDASKLPGFERLNEVQQAAVVSMVFQMGLERVKGFKDFCTALAAGDVVKAAAEGRDSKWDREDSHARAEREMKMLESGIWQVKS